MTRYHRPLSIASFLLSTACFVQAVFADDHIDVEYAERMPLATESLLLDITRSGDTLVAVGERGHVVVSTDGENWTQAEHVPTRSTLTTVFSFGDRFWAGGHDAVILTSGDGGLTWTELFFDPDRQQAVMDIFFSDEDNGIAIGSYGLYLQTSDGGRSWVESLVDEESDYHLNNLLDFGDGKWLIAGEAGLSYRSYDSGETWMPIDLPYQGSMWGALRTNDECVIFYGLRGHIMESCDFGTSWKEVDTGSEASISGAVADDGLILLGANGGTVLIRDDSGRFEVHHHSSGVDFAGVLSLGDGQFLLVGEDGIHDFPETTQEGDGDD
jgi:photosystem II stability/assembly factor-like uncharacterized protein